ncbi:putative enzyme related to lactoylglutathione lyase [Rhizobium petrolearium]|uniref:VOC family protein n=1 Tax=Neorhizobium petrolearium TaxID=515361 RepID=UPI001AEB8FEA|nr:VOC family protein [Neorhizobium petrolearium]MBP1843072.1 putative enzyme related to lactoylglutathione lyase [Neorhizobium petrolearium]
MVHPDFVILFVDNPLASAEFYQSLFGVDPVERSATFALFILPTGLKVGLWSRHTAQPLVTGGSGGMEICFRREDATDVDRIYADWAKRGLRVLQTPVQMDFGYTFVMTDPDGHRLRVYSMGAE